MAAGREWVRAWAGCHALSMVVCPVVTRCLMVVLAQWMRLRQGRRSGL